MRLSIKYKGINRTYSVENIFQNLAMFFTLLNFGSVFSLIYPSFIIGITILCVLLLLYETKRFKLNLKLATIILCVLFFILLQIVVTRANPINYISLFIKFILVVFLIRGFDNNYSLLKESLIKNIYIIIILACINQILLILIPSLYIYKEVAFNDVNGYNVYTLGYIFNYVAKIDLGLFLLPRNQGIFWEPGVMQIPLNIYVYYYLIELKSSFKKVIIPILLIILSFSTTGFLILGIILICRFFDLFVFSRKQSYQMIFMLFVILLALPIIGIELNRKVNSPEMEVRGSSLARLYDMLMCVEIIKEYPFFGIGLNPEKQTMIMSDTFIDVEGLANTTRGNTNSILQLYVNFGVIISTLILFLLYNQRIFRSRKCFFLIYFLSMLSEPLMTNLFSILFIVSSINISKSDNSTVQTKLI